VRRRRLPAEGRPLRGAGRRAAEDRARPAAAVAGDRAPLLHHFRDSRVGDCAARFGFSRRRLGSPAAGADRDARPRALTPRENEVLTYLSKGFTIKEIASLMGIKWFTVNDHIKSIYKKLNVSSRAEAAVLATKQGLV
jgi:DNA-binding CsgD family transcriptional regulator